MKAADIHTHSIGEMTLIEEIDCDRDLLALHRLHAERYPCFLESVAHECVQGRFDILFAFPGSTLALETDGRLTCDGLNTDGNDFLHNFDQWWQQENSRKYEYNDNGSSLPFTGGWYVYLGYELVSQIESIGLTKGSCDDGLPVAYATRFPAAIIKDHVINKVFLVCESDQFHLLSEMKSDIENAKNITEIPVTTILDKPIVEDDPEDYLNAVKKIKRYIVEGDVFQVNLSRRWHGKLATDITEADIYQRLRKHNPAPFAALCRYQESAIISSSPERLVTVHDGTIETRPIAGTRPRGMRVLEDNALSDSLLSHPKERAEHIMLIDLERNDLGRVCTAGSIEVNELMVLESYAHVHHIVSNVRGRLRPAVTPGQVIRAVFPGGTITGCPKVRCMEIIAELEKNRRGPYTGSIGYINLNGNMDLNILIRTIETHNQDISFRAGAGIVADSNSEAELEETRDKARGLLLALY